MDVPDGIDVKAVENDETTVHITMPTPPSGHIDLSDDELTNAAGGMSAGNTTTMGCYTHDGFPFACD